MGVSRTLDHSGRGCSATTHIAAQCGPLSSTVSPPRPNVAGHLAALVQDMQDHGIRPTRLNVISYATDIGLPEHAVIALAALSDATKS